MNSLERLRNRLENLLSGLLEATPRTGSLAPARLSTGLKEEAEGFVWESDQDGKYVWISPEIERVLGYAPDELQGKEIFSIAFLPPKADELRELMASGQPVYNFRVRARNREGKVTALLLNALARADPAGTRIGYRGVAQVVALEEPTPAEETVRPLRLVGEPGETFETTPSKVWGEVHGYVADEGGLYPIPEPAETLTDVALTDTEMMRIPIRIQNRVLGVLEFEQPLEGRSWEADDQNLAQAVAQDLALALQNAQSHQITQQALDEMREADRLKSQFLANMSHELRTPLNSIIGFSRVILKGIDGPITETQEQDLTAIYNAGQHLLGLINDILDVSRIEAGKMELSFTEVDVKEIIRGVMSTAVGLVKDKPIRLVTEVPEDLPKIQADNIRVRQIMLNLVSNAAKFTMEGEIAVTARVVEDDVREMILVTVSDTGPGIDPENQKKLFEPFAMVDASPTRRTGGTGLGLSICHHLVELHGGNIWIDSVPGEGSTFAFTIPIEPHFPSTVTETSSDGSDE
ncbi:MAG: PAS domain S-box protein [Anaerolineales bacterium]|nr:PAS domain S-box protein [Anaerolineales bacterium]